MTAKLRPTPVPSGCPPTTGTFLNLQQQEHHHSCPFDSSPAPSAIPTSLTTTTADHILSQQTLPGAFNPNPHDLTSPDRLPNRATTPNPAPQSAIVSGRSLQDTHPTCVRTNPSSTRRHTFQPAPRALTAPRQTKLFVANQRNTLSRPFHIRRPPQNPSATLNPNLNVPPAQRLDNPKPTARQARNLSSQLKSRLTTSGLLASAKPSSSGFRVLPARPLLTKVATTMRPGPELTTVCSDRSSTKSAAIANPTRSSTAGARTTAAARALRTSESVSSLRETNLAVSYHSSASSSSLKRFTIDLGDRTNNRNFNTISHSFHRHPPSRTSYSNAAQHRQSLDTITDQIPLQSSSSTSSRSGATSRLASSKTFITTAHRRSVAGTTHSITLSSRRPSTALEQHSYLRSSTDPSILSSSVQSNGTVKPRRTDTTANRMDRIGSKINLKNRTSSDRASNSTRQELPVSSTRSKRLISMREKNERILANINAHLSPPSSPLRSRAAPEPDLPPPPPSSSSSSSNSSSTSSSGSPAVPSHSRFATIVTPSVPLHATPLLTTFSPPVGSDNLLVPGSERGGASGLISFAKGCSPSPRKVSSGSKQSAVRGRGSQPTMDNKLDAESEGEDHERLGSVRGKRAERLSRRTSGTRVSQQSPGELGGSGASAFAGEVGRVISSVNTPPSEIEDNKARQGSVRRAIAPTQDGPSPGPLGPSAPAVNITEQARAPRPRDHYSPTHDVSPQRTPALTPGDGAQLYPQCPEAVDQRPSSEQDRRIAPRPAEMLAPSDYHSDTNRSSKPTATHHLPADGDRQWSQTHSVHSSSSDTIGKLHTNHEPLSDSDRESYTQVLSTGRGAGTWSHDGRHDEQDYRSNRFRASPMEDEDENMPTPVKARPNQRTLRHASSVSEMMISGNGDTGVSSPHYGSAVGWGDMDVRSGRRHDDRIRSDRRSSSADRDHPQRLPTSVDDVPGAVYPIRDSNPTPRSSLGMLPADDDTLSRGGVMRRAHPSDSQSRPQSVSFTKSPPRVAPFSRLSSNMSATSHRAQSPQSHASSSNRRHRPALPQQFIQPTHQPDHSPVRPVASPDRQPRPSGRAPKSPQLSRTYTDPSSRLNSTRPVGDLTFSERCNPRHSEDDAFSRPIDRRSGVESALSHYDGHPSFAGRQYHNQVLRGKHSSWSAADDHEPIRSQSVLGGVYDPRNIGSTRLRGRTRPSLSPAASRPPNRRTMDYDDDELSATTYNHSNPLVRKTLANSQFSDWDAETDPELRHRLATTELRSGDRRGSLIMNPELTPARNRTSTERDRTVRGSGGTRSSAPKSLNHLGHSGDHVSTSSGGSSRRQATSQRSAGNHAASLLSGRRDSRPVSAIPLDNVHRQSRTQTHAESFGAMALAGLLSPTPDADHHKLLISAYEALDQNQSSLTAGASDHIRTLVGQLSSVIKSSCKIDATLKQLAEAGLNFKVEIELMDGDEFGRGHDATQPSGHSSPHKSSLKRKCEIMANTIAQTEKTHGQLMRSCNNHIRDLTEALITLNQLCRSKDREWMEVKNADEGPTGHTDSRSSLDQRQYIEDNRSISRTSRGYSGSQSPNKLRHYPNGISPLSIISSRDESPLSRLVPSQRHNSIKEPGEKGKSQQSSPLRQSRNNQPHRASTISFTHDRNLPINGVHSQISDRSRMSLISSKTAGQSHATSNSISSLGLEHSQSDAALDEFGLYRRSTDYPRSTGRSGRAFDGRRKADFARETAVQTIRGSQSSLSFPKTPPRLATSSLSQMNAQSHISPTKVGRESMDRRRPRNASIGELGERYVRPQSSMSQVIDRANSVLSRVGLATEDGYPISPSARRREGKGLEYHSRERSSEDSRIPQTGSRSNPYRSTFARRQERELEHEAEDRIWNDELNARRGARGLGRESSTKRSSRIGNTATAALERLSRMGSWSGKCEEEEDEEESRMRNTISSGYRVHCRGEEDAVDHWRDEPAVRKRQGSIRQLFSGLKKGQLGTR